MKRTDEDPNDNMLATNDNGCACDCGECRYDNCPDCTNEDCDDPNCDCNEDDDAIQEALRLKLAAKQ